MHIISFDYGTKKIGTALGNSEFRNIQKLKIVKILAKQNTPDWQSIDELVYTWQPELFIVGMPFNMDGTDSAMTKIVNIFIQQLRNRYQNVRLIPMDERLTSKDASYRLRDHNLQHNITRSFDRHEIDLTAAAILIEDYFNTI